MTSTTSTPRLPTRGAARRSNRSWCSDRARRGGRDPHHRLAGRIAAQETGEGLRGVLEPVDDGLPAADASVAHPGSDFPRHLAGPVDVAAATEAAQGEVVGDGKEEVARARRRA